LIRGQLLSPIEEHRKQIPPHSPESDEAIAKNLSSSSGSGSELADSKDAKKRKLKTMGLVWIHVL
jgi:hypothetical protein